MAVFNLAFNVGITISAFAAGELAERLGYSWMWIVMGLMAAGGALALALDRSRINPADRA
jgi:predicted MFS family arabinose efflux permease